MNQAIILHGTDSNSTQNWFPWLKKELEHRSWKVWVPDLPHANAPRCSTYNKYIFDHCPWPMNIQTTVIGHSSGAVAILGLLQELPNNQSVDTCYLIGSFNTDLGRKELQGLFEKPFDFTLLKTKAKKFVFIHADNDPFCPLEQAQYLCAQLHGEMHILPGQKHFSVSTNGEAYKAFPALLDILFPKA